MLLNKCDLGLEGEMGTPVYSGWLRFSGRRDAKSYFWFCVAFSIVYGFLAIVLLLSFIGSKFDLEYFWIVGLIVIIFKSIYYVVSAQRFRDFGITGWAALLLIPVAFLDVFSFGLAHLISSLVLWTVPGTRGENRYGPDPIEYLDMDFGPGAITKYEQSRKASARPAGMGPTKPDGHAGEPNRRIWMKTPAAPEPQRSRPRLRSWKRTEEEN